MMRISFRIYYFVLLPFAIGSILCQTTVAGFGNGCNVHLVFLFFTPVSYCHFMQYPAHILFIIDDDTALIELRLQGIDLHLERETACRCYPGIVVASHKDVTKNNLFIVPIISV